MVGIVNCNTRKLRLEITHLRTADIMKKIIFKHIKRGNIIVSDGWTGYNWISNIEYGYIHSVHNHGHGDFGLGLDSTSNIENIWAYLKSLIKRIYNNIPIKNFILFLREEEFRRSINNLTNNQKYYECLDILNYISNIGIDNLYPLETLESID